MSSESPVRKQQENLKAGERRPVFLHLSPIMIPYATRKAEVAARANRATDGSPTGGVEITLTGGAAVFAQFDQNGNFRAAVDTSALPVGDHKVICSYKGDKNFEGRVEETKITVVPAELIVAAADFSRNSGDQNPVFTGTVTGLLNNDKITAIYQCEATIQSPAGSYQILPVLLDPDKKLGNYRAVLSKGTLTVAAAKTAKQTGKTTVSPGKPAGASGAKPNADVPRIEGTILDEGGKPLPRAAVAIYDSSGIKVVGSTTTNDHGKFIWRAPGKGSYYIGPQGDASRKTQVMVQSAGSVTMRFPGGPTGPQGQGSGPGGRHPRESSRDFFAYPILTENVGYSPSPASPPPGVMGGNGGMSPLGQMATNAVADVLGWKINSSDPKGFVGALTQSFTLTDVEGHVQSKWVPRSYVVQTDLAGGITGAQASLFTRAKEALDQCQPLLDGIYALDPEADPEYVKALRELAGSQMSEIVKQLGLVGGPSILRVDTYFKILLWGPAQFSGSVPTDADSLNPQSTLGSLRDECGIRFAGNPFSNSIEDEQDITNFRIIVDYMISLWQSWLNNRPYFLLGQPQGGKPAFFGTQLVLISRQFSVIAETISEVRFVCDSVFIGPSERQTLLLQFADPNTPPAFLEGVLSEIENVVTDEGPRLIRDGGRLSVNNNLLPVVESLRGMVAQIRAHQITNLHDLPDGFKTGRIGNAFDDLHSQLSSLVNLVQQVGRDLPTPERGLLVLPPAVAFGQILVGQASEPQPVTIANQTSGAFLNVHVEVSGDGFSLDPPFDDRGLDPNWAVSAFVVFEPAEAITYQGTLVVKADDQLIIVPLTGIGQTNTSD